MCEQSSPSEQIIRRSGVRIPESPPLHFLGAASYPADRGIKMHPIIETNRIELRKLGERYGALSVSVFGSMARGDATKDSDVDLLIEPGRALSGFDLGALLMDAQELLGRQVDIVTLSALHPLTRERVLAEAIRL